MRWQMLVFILLAASCNHAQAVTSKKTTSSISKREAYVLEDTITMPPEETLHIHNDRGAVFVYGKDVIYPHIEVHAYGPPGYANHLTLQQTQETRHRAVTTAVSEVSEHKRSHGRRASLRSLFTYDYYVTVPHKQNVSITSSESSQVSVAAISGHLGISGVYMPCSIHNIGSSVSIDIQQGDITLDTAREYIDVSTAGGSVTLRHIYGDVTARALQHLHVHDTHGNIFLRSHRSYIDMDAVYGIINAQSRTNMHIHQSHLTPETCMFLESGHAVDLYLPVDVDARLYAKSAKHIVTSDIPITLDPMTTRLSRDIWKQLQKHVKGVFRSGGASITINATGYIHVHKKENV